MDTTSMNIQRRQIADLAQRPDDLTSAHLFADGSPVTGSEVQGMVLELCLKTGEVQTSYLPGISLTHGFMRWIDKAFALMWAFVVDRRTNAGAFYFPSGESEIHHNRPRLRASFIGYS